MECACASAVWTSRHISRNLKYMSMRTTHAVGKTDLKVCEHRPYALIIYTEHDKVLRLDGLCVRVVGD